MNNVKVAREEKNSTSDKVGGREYFLDIARGIAILFVVIGHKTDPYGFINRFAYSFHMPLFFIISGYLINTDKYSMGEYTVKRFLRLMLPYIAWSVYSFIPLVISHGDLKSFIFGFLYSSGKVSEMSGGIIADMPWFLQCLFFAELLFTGLMKLLKKTRIRTQFLFPVFVVLALIGWFIGSFFNITWLPFSIDLVLFVQIYLYAGYLLKRKRLFAQKKDFRFYAFIAGCFVLWIVGVVCSLKFAREETIISMNERNITLYSLALSFAGGISVLYLSVLLAKIPVLRDILSYFGIISVVIYLFHLDNMAFLNEFFVYGATVEILLRILYSIAVAEIIRLICGLNKVFSLKPYKFEMKLWDSMCKK